MKRRSISESISSSITSSHPAKWTRGIVLGEKGGGVGGKKKETRRQIMNKGKHKRCSLQIRGKKRITYTGGSGKKIEEKKEESAPRCWEEDWGLEKGSESFKVCYRDAQPVLLRGEISSLYEEEEGEGSLSPPNGSYRLARDLLCREHSGKGKAPAAGGKRRSREGGSTSWKSTWW